MTGDPPLVLGVDAGNSKTVAVVADVNGRVLGFGRAGNGDIYGAATEQAAVDAVIAAADAAMTAAYGRADHTRLGTPPSAWREWTGSPTTSSGRPAR